MISKDSPAKTKDQKSHLAKVSSTDIVSEADVKHVAKLSNLPVTENEVSQYKHDLSPVLELVSKINELNTQEVPETNQVTGLTNVFREDVADPSRMLTQAQALSMAKTTHKGYFVVKAVID